MVIERNLKSVLPEDQDQFYLNEKRVLFGLTDEINLHENEKTIFKSMFIFFEIVDQ